MGIYKTEKYEKKVCIIDISTIDLKYPILTDKILIQKDSVINTWFSYDWSSHNDYFIKMCEVYKQVSDEIYNKKFITLAESRQNQIDSIIN